MQERRVTKAAFSLSSALFVSVVLVSSVAEHNVAASKSALPTPVVQAASTTQNKLVSSQLKHASGKPFLVAQLAIPTSAPVTNLLPVVNQPSIHANQQVLADAVLRRLPSECRDNLKNFYVLYKGATQRGLGGKTSIIIDGNAPDNEFIGLMVHECGHVIHGNLLGNVAVSGVSAFKDGKDIFANDSAASFFAISWTTPQVAKVGPKEDYVTGYAQSDCFEDFAETFTTYVLERPSLEARAKTNTVIAAKLAWMKQHLPLSDTLLGTPEYNWDKKVPWDATKLAFVWSPEALSTIQ